MSLKFYLDTHIPKQVAIQLRSHNIDVVRCEDVGMHDATDEEHLIYAALEDRVTVTKDDDFIKLHMAWQAFASPHGPHGGIFFCGDRQRPAIGQIIKFCVEMVEIVAAGAASFDGDIKDQVFFIS